MALSGRAYCDIGCGGATVALSGRAYCGIEWEGLLWH